MDESHEKVNNHVNLGGSYGYSSGSNNSGSSGSSTPEATIALEGNGRHVNTPRYVSNVTLSTQFSYVTISEIIFFSIFPVGDFSELFRNHKNYHFSLSPFFIGSKKRDF